MNFEELCQIENEAERVSKTYEIFQEDVRLSGSQAARVEFLTTIHYIRQALRPGARILDIGAGTGAYSFYLAGEGYQVDALELADHNVEVFQNKLMQSDGCVRERIRLVQGNALDLSGYQEESFDVVLLFGPLYHLSQEKDRQQCIAQARRVCKKDGTMFVSFIAVKSRRCWDGVIICCLWGGSKRTEVFFDIVWL